ncbi:amidase signature enzyme [Hyaloraphidium curvatum]|nr:amidase signature enzyme [Hyaloraphidium curvatum]
MFWEPKWRRIANAKKARQEALIPAEWRLPAEAIAKARSSPSGAPAAVRAALSARELEITELDAPELVKLLSSGKLKSEEATRAFCKRSALAHQLTNCLSEIMFEEAIEDARKIDEEFARTGRSRGLLHGLPVSVKDHFDVKGVDTTTGFVAWAENPAAEDGAVVKRLREHGAVIMCKTNVPQSMMTYESDNPVFGWTANPNNTTLTCGGSSGGEGALLALRGSPLGCGSDVGGSIRVPSHFNGIFGLKPSSLRVPATGAPNVDMGQHGVPGVFGPMGHSVEGLRLWMRAVVGTEGEGAANRDDPFTVPLPMRAYPTPAKLRLGYFVDTDTGIRVTPPCRRAVLETVEKLRAAGHEVEEIRAPSVREVMKMFAGLIFAGDYVDIKRQLAKSGEPVEASIKSTIDLVRLGNRGRKFVAALLSTFTSDNLMPEILSSTKTGMTAPEYFDLMYQRDLLLGRWLAWYNAQMGGRMDAIICPPAPFPATVKGWMKDLILGLVYTTTWNVMDWSAGIVPVTRVDPVRDAPAADYAKNTANRIDDAVARMYAGEWGPAGSRMANAPVGVQIVGRRLEEEKVLAVMEVVGKVVGPLPPIVEVAAASGKSKL